MLYIFILVLLLHCDVIVRFIYIISFHSIFHLYPDLMGHHVRGYDVFNLLCLADGISIIHYLLFICFIQLYPDVMGNCVLRLYDVFNLLCWQME